MFAQKIVDEFEIFRANSYRAWTAPSGQSYRLNQQPYLDVVLTDRCNRICKFCIADLIEKKEDCDVAVFQNQIDWAIENLGVQEVLVVGGEPTVSRHIIPVLDHLNQRLTEGALKKICLTTNGDRLHRDGEVTDFARGLLSRVTHLNLSLMSSCAEAQRSIAGGRGSFLSVERDLPAIWKALPQRDRVVSLRVNANIFRGNLDSADSVVEFYAKVSPFCDSVKFSPLLRVDSFSVVNATTEWVRDNILPPDEYEALYREIEGRFSEYPIVRNPETFGFVEYSMLCMDTPLVLNYNHRNRMAERAAAGFVNNIKLLTNGNLSLSWNRDDAEKVIRHGA